MKTVNGNGLQCVHTIILFPVDAWDYQQSGTKVLDKMDLKCKVNFYNKIEVKGINVYQ